MKSKIPDIGVMPAIGLGTWRLQGNTCQQAVKTALELGYRHIDTAVVYENHRDIAQAIKGFSRHELFLVSKIIHEDLRPSNVKKACLRILSELGTSYLDVLLIHWPIHEIPAEDSLGEMVKLQEEGLIRHLGVSNFKHGDLEHLEKFHFPILTNQIELHPSLPETDLTAYCQKHNIIVTAYTPLESGNVDQHDTLVEIGRKYHKTPSQVTLRWIYQRNIVSIPKASSKAHLAENLDIFDFELTNDEMQSIFQLETGRHYV